MEVFQIVDNSTANVFAYRLNGCEVEFEDSGSQTNDSEPEEVPIRHSALIPSIYI